MDEFRATFDELSQEYEEQARRVREAYGRLGELEATARSADEMVTVKVGPRGKVLSIELNPRVYRRLAPSELAQTIMEQIDRAAACVADRTRDLMAPLLPDGVPYEKILGDDMDIDAFLPRPRAL
ncbi:hypothetical protein Misp01_32470 [Microtetraspora sp. NBRC 13810]|uniref:YbaB/EbfC family nucleoid-associated protein n=1 Tax=Microtetraspora sp. NBRC 13810 TaxID=3030990 RepID=UPI0024A17051|nr:YbaB/EbfC family nucleoid-associated protein [Microtetraspora sp. NBRC 13810]GLW08117.1 hypothetical protein Misp01_32470 [Microtetraspora sp. NBRC 13810]